MQERDLVIQCCSSIDIALLDEMHSSTVLSLLDFFCDVAVGVGGSVERDDQLAGIKRSHDGDPPGELGCPRPRNLGDP